MKTQKRQIGSTNDLDTLVDEYLAKGNKITKCPPGPSEEVVYKNQYRKRPKKPEAKTETPVTQTAVQTPAEAVTPEAE